MTPLLTVAEVAEQLRCGEWVVKNRLRSGELEGSKPFGKWLVEQEAVDRFLEATRNGQHATRRRRRRSTA